MDSLGFPVPGLTLRGSSSRDVLKATSRRLQRLPECEVWSRNLHARLEDSHEAVAAHESEQWRVQYCDVLKRFSNLLRAKPLLERLAGAESIAYTFQELNSKLDEICVGVGAMDSSAQGQWQADWANACQVQATQLEAQVQATDPSLIIRQLRGEKEVTKVMLDMSSSVEADPSTRLADLKRATLERLRLYLGLDTSANVAKGNFKWYISERDVEIGEPIYTVEEWVVSRAKWRSRSGVVQDVTVKTLFDAVSESALATQIRLWYELPDHPNIVKLYGGSHLARKPFMVYKDGPHSDIFQFFRQEENRGVFWRTFVGVAEGLKFLHEHKIVYGGLTGRSILVSADNTPQISDLDCSYVLSVSGRLSQKTDDVLMSRLRWTPRERLLDSIPDDPQYKSEIYSLGMCIIEAMTQVVPFGLIDDEDVMEKIISGEPYERPAEASDEEWGVISRLIAADVGDRPGIDETISLLRSLGPLKSPGELLSDANLLEERSKKRKRNEERSDMGSTIVDETNDRPFGLITPEMLHSLRARCVGGFVIFRGIIERMQGLLNFVNIHDMYDEQIPVEVGILQQLEEILASKYTRHDGGINRGDSTDGERKISILGMLQMPQRAAFAFSAHRRLDGLVNSSWGRVDNMMSWLSSWEDDRRAQAQYFISLFADAGLGITIDRVTAPAFQGGVQFWEKRKFALVQEELAVLQKIGSLRAQHPARQQELSTPIPIGLTENPTSAISPSLFVVSEDQVEVENDVMATRVSFGEWLSTPITACWISQDKVAAAELWHSLHHPHVLNLLGCCKTPRGYKLFTERPEYLNLVEYLQSDGHTQCVWQRLYEVALGLQYIHEIGIIHADVKCKNISVEESGAARIGGLYDSFYARDSSSKIQDPTTDDEARWRSPEELGAESTPTQASDVYSLGMVVIEAVTGDVPWTSMTARDDILIKVTSGLLPDRPTGFTDAQWALVQRMCYRNPDERSSIQDVVHNLSKFAEDEYHAQADTKMAVGFSLPNSVPSGGELARVLRCDWISSLSRVKDGLTPLDRSGVQAASPSSDQDRKGAEGGGDGGDSCGEKVESELRPIWFIPEYETWTAEFEHCGETATSSRHLGTWLDAAVVIEHENESSDARRKTVMRIADTWYQLKHPNVLHLFGACHVAAPPFYVFEYAAFGTLNMYLKREKHAVDNLWHLLYELSCGLQYLHTRGIIHDDLKCDNILITQNGKVKLSQFRFSSAMGESSALTRWRSARWTAPELLHGAQPSFASDIYSLGMCIIEAATNQLPWGTDRSDMLVNVKVKVKGLIPPKPSMLTKHQWHLVRRMCAKDPAARPDIQKVTHQLRCFAAVENEVIKQHNICRSDEYCLPAQEMVFVHFNKLYGAELESNDIDSLNSYGSDDINECETVEHITKMAALQVLDSQWKTRVQDPQQEISDSFADLQLGDAEDCEISVHPWRINPKDLTWGTEIGTGGFGKVFSGTWLSAAVAIKEFKKTTEADLEMFRRELDIWYLLNHPHIVNLFGAGDEDKYYFICDLANSKSKGNLSRCGSNFEKKHVWKLLYQTASALQHLHSRGIVHGDVKGNNVLIKGDGQAQLTDFGLSFRQTGMTNNSTAPTTAAVRWKAPECFTKTGSSSISPTPASNREATAMSDVYALGMCILEAVSGRFPWGFIPDLAVEHHVRNGEIPQQPSCFTNTEWELVKRMCRFEKEKRLQLPIVVKLLGIFAFDNVAHVADRLFLSKMVSDSAQAKLEVRPQRGLEFPIGANFHTAGNLLAA